MLTGKIAGLSAANDLAAVDGFEEKFADYQGQLQMLRQGRAEQRSAAALRN